MSTVTKHEAKEQKTPQGIGSGGDRKLRRDRIMAIVVLVLIGALMAGVIWLASLGGTPADIDYWPMM